MANDSPCTDICQYDPKRKWCLGCGRTAEEIRGWKKLTPYRRTALSAELQRRMTVMEKAK